MRHAITGYIYIQEPDDPDEPIGYHWFGGNVIAVSGLYLQNTLLMQREGDEIQIGPYRVIMIEYIGKTDTYICQRIHE